MNNTICVTDYHGRYGFTHEIMISSEQGKAHKFGWKIDNKFYFNEYPNYKFYYIDLSDWSLDIEYVEDLSKEVYNLCITTHFEEYCTKINTVQFLEAIGFIKYINTPSGNAVIVIDDRAYTEGYIFNALDEGSISVLVEKNRKNILTELIEELRETSIIADNGEHYFCYENSKIKNYNPDDLIEVFEDLVN